VGSGSVTDIRRLLGYAGTAIRYAVDVDERLLFGEEQIERLQDVEIADGVCQDLTSVRIIAR